MENPFMKKNNLGILATAVSALLFSMGAFASDAGVSAGVRGPGEGEMPSPAPMPGDGNVNHGCYYAYHIRKVGPHHAKEGNEIRYKIFVTNIGNCKLRDIGVKDFLPRHTKFIDAYPKPGFVHDRTVVWKDIDLPVGEKAEFVVKVETRNEDRNPHHDFVITNVGCAFTRFIGIRICDQASTRIHDDHGPWDETVNASELD
jgi:uncharacterized repeat protein (TIGR01451 family)